jgi:hypothetical protein
MFPPEEQDYRPTAVGHTMFVDRIDCDVAATNMEHLGASDAAMWVGQLRVLGRATARVPGEARAFTHRLSFIMVTLAAFYEGRTDVRQAWVDRFVAAFHGTTTVPMSSSSASKNPDASARPTLDRPGSGLPPSSTAGIPQPLPLQLVRVKAPGRPSQLFHIHQSLPVG